jgi:HSP20 family molecular chaperone IbpA
MRDMEEIQNRLASLFGRRLPLRKEGTEEGFTLTEWSPPVDIAEDEKEYTIKAELPGVNKVDVKVTVEGGVLSITGERKAEGSGAKFIKGMFLSGEWLCRLLSGQDRGPNFRSGGCFSG